VHKHFFQSKMILDVHKGVEDVDKPKEEEEETGYTDIGNLKSRFDNKGVEDVDKPKQPQQINWSIA